MDEKRGKFIVLGKKRIKIGNIKNYGISSSMKDYEKIYKPISSMHESSSKTGNENKSILEISYNDV